LYGITRGRLDGRPEARGIEASANGFIVGHERLSPTVVTICSVDDDVGHGTQTFGIAPCIGSPVFDLLTLCRVLSRASSRGMRLALMQLRPVLFELLVAWELAGWARAITAAVPRNCVVDTLVLRHSGQPLVLGH